MAGEDVRWMGKPNTKLLLIYEGVIAVGACVLLAGFIALTSGLPAYMVFSAAIIFALCGTGIVHYFISTSTYVISDRRVLVVSDFSSQLTAACDLEEITGYTMPGFGNILIIQRSNGRPIRLFAIADRKEAENALNDEEPEELAEEA